MDSLNAFVAQSLRRHRQERGWSLDRAAAQTGVSKAMLGQIERGESSPTLATLWKIASGFGLSLSSLLEPAQAVQPRLVKRSAHELRHQPTRDAMLVAPLFPFDPRLKFEMYELTLPPGYCRESEPHAPGVYEHVIVVAGRMELLAEAQWHPLQSGEAMAFAADSPHGYRNSGAQAAVIHNLIHYPGETPAPEAG